MKINQLDSELTSSLHQHTLSNENKQIYLKPLIATLNCHLLIKGGGPNLDESQNANALNS